MIEVKNLSKKYGKHQAVSDLSFTVEDGLITGFLGPNGAGKSTTMNMMTGFLAPSNGTVLINGIDMQKEPEKAKKLIGYLPEQPPVYMDMTVREYLLFVAELKKVPSKERWRQINKIEQMISLEEVDSRLIKNLSKGFRQRVGFAQALVGFPPIIILDEPMVGLDPKQIIEIRDLIRQLKENHTVILSSHILSEINMICDKIMIISNGKLVAYDTPEQLVLLGTKREEFHITAKGNKEAVSHILEGLGDISFELTEKDDGKLCDLIVKSNSEKDISEDIFFAFADARTPITELHHITGSLEDIFLELTDESENDSDSSGAEDSAATAPTPADTADSVSDIENDDKTDIKEENE